MTHIWTYAIHLSSSNSSHSHNACYDARMMQLFDFPVLFVLFYFLSQNIELSNYLCRWPDDAIHGYAIITIDRDVQNDLSGEWFPWMQLSHQKNHKCWIGWERIWQSFERGEGVHIITRALHHKKDNICSDDITRHSWLTIHLMAAKLARTSGRRYLA